MKQPKQPVKPRKPSKPSEYLPGEIRTISFYTGESLAEIIKGTKDLDLDPEKVYFHADCGYYDDYTYEFYGEDKPRLNPNYKKQLAKYELDMIEYYKDLEIYNSNLKEYNSLNKQYLKWFHQNELKKLG